MHTPILHTPDFTNLSQPLSQPLKNAYPIPDIVYSQLILREWLGKEEIYYAQKNMFSSSYPCSGTDIVYSQLILREGLGKEEIY